MKISILLCLVFLYVCQVFPAQARPLTMSGARIQRKYVPENGSVRKNVKRLRKWVGFQKLNIS